MYRFLLSHSGLFAYINIRIRNYLATRQDANTHVKRKPPLQSELILKSQRLIRSVLNQWSRNRVPMSLLILPEGDAFRGFDSSRKEALLAQEIEKNCERLHLSCVDMKQALLEEFMLKHNLAKGFVNSIPGKGHLNKAGHAVVAEQLAKELEKVSL